MIVIVMLLLNIGFGWFLSVFDVVVNSSCDRGVISWGRMICVLGLLKWVLNLIMCMLVGVRISLV